MHVIICSFTILVLSLTCAFTKNLLSVILENIGNLSRLIRFDLHQNCESIKQGVTFFFFSIFWHHLSPFLPPLLKISLCNDVCRSFINPTINNGWLFSCGVLYGVIYDLWSLYLFSLKLFITEQKWFCSILLMEYVSSRNLPRML